ncbi:MAG: winged helix-turn-helix domain-containing protein [Cellvibrio sp.]
MSVVYISKGFKIHPHRQLIEQNDECIAVRPKTFSLLLLLLERPQEILDKQYLLEKIWDDVSVEEAVLVQSIRELRQLFKDKDIIKTYPRKGYAWSVDVKKHLLNSESEAVRVANKPLKSAAYIAIALTTVAAMIILCIYTFQQKPSAMEVVVILPIKNEIQGNDHTWVSLGGMDQLIHSLPSNKHTQIMSTEYVLQLMQHAKISRDYSEIQAARIFDVSGASLVVEIKLSGSVEEYRLDYKLRRYRDVKPGVVFDNTLEGALQKLGSRIATHTGLVISSSDVIAQNEFAHELMARAFEKMDSGEFQLANSLLATLKQLDPDNIAARQMLAQTMLQLKHYDSAKAEIKLAIPTANQADQARLYFLLAEVEFKQGLATAALTTLDHTEKLSESLNDILYSGYTAQLRGDIQHQLGSLPAALHSYELAIKHFNIIRCPIGSSITHLKMAKLLLAHRRADEAKNHYEVAKQLIIQHKLNKLEPMLAEIGTLI